MAEKVKVLMPLGNGKKKIIEAFEGSFTHKLALEGLKGYAMPDATAIEQDAKAQKKTANRAEGKLPVEEKQPEIQELDPPTNKEESAETLTEKETVEQKEHAPKKKGGRKPKQA